MRRLRSYLIVLAGLADLADLLVAAAPGVRVHAVEHRASRLRIAINIPAYRLDAFVDDSLVRSIPIAVGMPSFKSPRGEFTLTSVEWNPWWIPPASNWAAKEQKTPPGPSNPMGRVKINFHDLYFLHGTPLDASVGSAASHGCIRLHNADAIALAELVLGHGAPRLTAGDVARLAADSATRRIELTVPTPIAVKYDRVEVRGDSVFVYRDIYGLSVRRVADELDSALVDQGVDVARIDRARVRAFTRSIARHGNAAAIADLSSGGGGR